MDSRHYSEERQKRENCIKNTIGYGKVIKSVRLDNGHRNGPEIHTISDTGIICIYNERTGRLVTKLIARPGQIKRYYNGDEPQWLIAKAMDNQKKGYNLI